MKHNKVTTGYTTRNDGETTMHNTPIFKIELTEAELCYWIEHLCQFQFAVPCWF
jgi:hypothetical protein